MRISEQRACADRALTALPRVRRLADPINVAIGRRIRERRRYLGLRRDALAAALGVGVPQLVKYETGQSTLYAVGLIRASAVLETTVAFLVGEQAVSPVLRTDGLGLETKDAPLILEAFARITEPESQLHLIGLVQALAAGADKRRWQELGRKQRKRGRR